MSIKEVLQDFLCDLVSLAKRKLKKPVSIIDTGLVVAAGEGHLEQVRSLLASGANPGATDEIGRTALGEAARGHTDIVRILLEAGAKPTPTAMHSAAGVPGYPDIVRCLLEAGADPMLGSWVAMGGGCLIRPP